MSKTAKKAAKKKKAAPKKKSPAKKAKAAKKSVKKTAKKAAKKTVKKSRKLSGAKKKTVVKKPVKKVIKKSRKLSGAKKAAPKKAVKKVVAKKAAVKKVVAKKPAVKKPVAKKVVAKPAHDLEQEQKETLTAPAHKTPETSEAPKVSNAKAEVVKKISEKQSVLPGGIIVKTDRKENISTNPNPRPALLNAIIEGLEERKAKNIVVLDLHKIENRSFDYFVIADADSNTHVEAIAGSVEEEVKKKTGEKPYHSEGWQNAEWILLDYINIVVHVFQKPVRDFYNIEDLWADAEMQRIN